MPRKPPARRPDQYVGEQVRLARKSKRWLQSDLVKRLEALGATNWRQTKIAKIENGETKRLSLADTLELAAALGVQPALLLSPAEGDVQVTPKVRRSAEDFRAWLRSQKPLRPEDERTYASGDLVPEDEWRTYVKSGGASVRLTASGRAKKGGSSDAR